MFKILNKYEEDGLKITEYTKDDVTVSHIIKTPIQTEPIKPESAPTLAEQIYAENLYQTALLEIQQMLGGM